MMRRNVLVLTPWYPTREYRYGGVFVQEYAKSVRSCWNVVVLHTAAAYRDIPGWWAAEKETDQGLTGGVPSYRPVLRRSRVRGFNRLRYWCSLHHTVRTIVAEHGPPELVHAHVYSAGTMALRIGRIYRIPVVISEHSSAFSRGLLSVSELARARSVFRRVDAVLPVSDALRDTLERLGVIARFQVVPNVVDTDLFKYRPHELMAGGRMRLLAVSSLVELKGLRVLFRALVSTPMLGRIWHLDVVGSGPEAIDHQRVVEDLGLAKDVTFHGQLNKEQIAAMMSTADLFILPSLFETFSVVTAEALASGVPVVATRCGGPEGYVTDRSGVLVLPGDAAVLSEGIARACDHLATFDRAAIADTARARFRPERVGSMIGDLYSSLLERP